MQLYQLSSDPLHFPEPGYALHEPNGLLAFGGDLSPVRLKTAYRQGIFPWYSPGEPILWWSPDPRAVLFPNEFHISRSLKKFLRKHDYSVTINRAFNDVITACSREHEGGTWITPEIIAAYCELHQSGQAHSVEVWQNSALVGGLYGIAQGSLFCGESMFSLAENASKYALLTFQQHFTDCGGRLIDCQVLNAHTASLGVREIPREHFLQFLFQLRDIPVVDRCWVPQILAEPIR
ncbi:leucyl/phenylalanyl-tRNA--protein transferase [Pectobacterium sp. B1J-3]|uniref:leucyl/phenylalanyl-tRNA--protein transferase n=1 Tax=Pectobacterium sp. B1J-3 TaxID=3385371 RepID=UPI003906D156